MRVHLPLQQGLRRHALIIYIRQSERVRVHLPLQQGLRLICSTITKFFILVRVHLPLQQGLRPRIQRLLSRVLRGASASSITTRIKTCVGRSYVDRSPCASASSITTRIKTRIFANL